MKVLKLYAWESSFISAIGDIRRKELLYLRKGAFLDCAISFVFNCAPFLVSYAVIHLFLAHDI